MREVHGRQFEFGQVPVEKIWIDPKSRGRHPGGVEGASAHLVRRGVARAVVCAARRACPAGDRPGGRASGDGALADSGAGGVEAGSGLRLRPPSRPREPSRDGARVPGARAISATRHITKYQTGARQRVSVDAGTLLSEVGRLVVESGHAVAKKKPGEPLRGRCDSFVVETDVHYPTDVSLLWDAMRCVLRETGRAAGDQAAGGWRQWRHLSKEVRKLFNQVRSTRRAKRRPERVGGVLGALPCTGRAGRGDPRGVAGQGRRGSHLPIHPGLYRACPAPDRPSRAPTPAGRDDCSRGEGVLGLRGAYSLGFQGQGRHAG